MPEKTNGNGCPLVSIIVPVFNAEQYLEACVKSLTVQTYRDIEIILADDGSSDGSLLLCRALAEMDPRIKVLHTENQGVSKTRNYGVSQSSGQYVMYVDSDDVLTKDAVSEGVEYLTEHGLEFVIGAELKISDPAGIDDVKSFDRESEILTPENFDQLRLQYFQCGPERYNTISGNGLVERAPHARILSRELAEKVPFPEGMPLGEDVIWNMRLLDRCDRIGIVHSVWYGYVIQSSSAVRRYREDRVGRVEAYIDILKNENAEFFEKNPQAMARNLAVELYCIANYQLSAENCPMSGKEKRTYIRSLLLREPWSTLNEPHARKFLSLPHRAMYLLYKTGLWEPALGMYGKLKGR